MRMRMNSLMKSVACCVLGVMASVRATGEVGPWVYYPSEGIISNGVGASAGWRLRVSVEDAASAGDWHQCGGQRVRLR